MAENEADGQNRTGSTRARQDRFIAAYRNCCNIRAACDDAGIGRTTFYEWRDADPEFADRVAHAHEDGLDSLEEAGWQRAKEMSDVLLKFFLEAGRPSKYRGVLKIDWRSISAEQLIALAGGGAAGIEAAGNPPAREPDDES